MFAKRDFMVVEQQLERARLELLDMGLRANPQLNYRNSQKSLSMGMVRLYLN